MCARSPKAARSAAYIGGAMRRYHRSVHRYSGSTTAMTTASRQSSAATPTSVSTTVKKVFVNEGTPYGLGGEGHLRIVHGCYRSEDVVDQALGRIKTALTRLAAEKGIR